jgi:hypothetical protein
MYGLCWCHIRAAHLVFSSTALAFLTNVSEKCKSASRNAIQMKNRRKTIDIEEIMLDLLMVLYVKLVIMLIELKKVQSQEQKSLCSKSTTVLSE